MNLDTSVGSKHTFKITRKKILIIVAILLIAAAVIGINYFKSKTLRIRPYSRQQPWQERGTSVLLSQDRGQSVPQKSLP